MEKRFDEGFDNILIYDFDREYQKGRQILAASLVTTAGRETISLNGVWRFSPDPFGSLIQSRWFDEIRQNRYQEPIPYDFDFEQWEEIQVPGVWNASRPEYGLYEGGGIYFRTFSPCQEWDGQRIYLKIGGANYETRLWLNGQYLGRHLGGFTPFCVEITECVKKENRLIVFVDNQRKGNQIPSLHYDWFNYGGIFRDVEVFAVPTLHIKAFKIQLSRTEKGCLDYEIALEDISSGSHEQVPARVCIGELGMEKTVVCEMQKPEGDSQEKRSLKGKGFIPIDEQSARCVTRDEIEAMLYEAKELGCNFLRLTHYPHSPWVSRLADRIGIMLLEEIPVYWALEFENPASYKDAANQLTELILRDQNRASVIIWSVGNENPDSDARYHFMKNLADVAREMDTTRLIVAACLIDVEQARIRDRLIDVLDVVGINEYYGWYLKGFGTLVKILDQYDGKKPVIITETGADAACGYFSDTKELYSEDLQADIYEKQFQILLRYGFIRGITPWILYDYVSMRRRNHWQKGYNIKGIMGADRIYKKKAYDVVKKVYHEKSATDSC